MKWTPLLLFIIQDIAAPNSIILYSTVEKVPYKNQYRNIINQQHLKSIEKSNMPSSTRLPTRALGRDGPQIPALGLGLMGLSSKSFRIHH